MKTKELGSCSSCGVTGIELRVQPAAVMAITEILWRLSDKEFLSNFQAA
jgi:hypothetical protein